ncbi:MAG: hypothetical protein ACLP29_06980 [Dissulfurispiraceae bacterium]|jgi:tetratricopeptide (TPR) repeat protein
MGKILQFPAKKQSKFGFERVNKHRGNNATQMNLFSSGLGSIRDQSSYPSTFDEALLLDERNDMDAEKLYRRAISEDDHVADAYCNLGIIESRAGRTAKAFDCFTRALEYDARHFEAHYNLGNLYFEADNLKLAKMHYELAIKIRSDFPNLYFNLGLVLAVLGERKAAVVAFVKHRLLSPNYDHRLVDSLIRKLNKL